MLSVPLCRGETPTAPDVCCQKRPRLCGECQYSMIPIDVPKKRIAALLASAVLFGTGLAIFGPQIIGETTDTGSLSFPTTRLAANVTGHPKASYERVRESLQKQVPPPNISWMPASLNPVFQEWWHLKEMYLALIIEDPIINVCEKNTLDPHCCNKIINTVEDERWKFYLIVCFGICLGLSMAYGIFLLGSSTLPFPPKYWVNYTWTACLKDSYCDRIDVTSELKETVQDLIDMTTLSRFMGRGNDGAFIKHKGFEVLKVERVENGSQWSYYARNLQGMKKVETTLKYMHNDDLKKHVREAQMLMEQRHQDMSQKSGRVGKFLSMLNFDRSRNETLMFHGCPTTGARDPKTGDVKFASFSPAETILKAGFDDRLSLKSGMLGSGLYFADHASKADQYAGKYGLPEESTVGEEAHMFLVRLPLGATYTTEQSLNEMRRPPCIQGHFDASLEYAEPPDPRFGGKPWKDKGLELQMCDHRRFDSVMSGKTLDGKHKDYREYSIFGRAAYPEFFITYKRLEAPMKRSN